jgi:hypothetical protein
MAAPRENWTDVVGRVSDITPDDTHPDFFAVTIEVEGVEPVDDFPNFLANRTDATARILVPATALQHQPLTPGDRIRCRTRWAPQDQLFAHPEGIQILPP